MWCLLLASSDHSFVLVLQSLDLSYFGFVSISMAFDLVTRLILHMTILFYLKWIFFKYTHTSLTSHINWQTLWCFKVLGVRMLTSANCRGDARITIWILSLTLVNVTALANYIASWKRENANTNLESKELSKIIVCPLFHYVSQSKLHVI